MLLQFFRSWGNGYCVEIHYTIYALIFVLKFYELLEGS